MSSGRGKAENFAWLRGDKITFFTTNASLIDRKSYKRRNFEVNLLSVEHSKVRDNQEKQLEITEFCIYSSEKNRFNLTVWPILVICIGMS